MQKHKEKTPMSQGESRASHPLPRSPQKDRAVAFQYLIINDAKDTVLYSLLLSQKGFEMLLPKSEFNKLETENSRGGKEDKANVDPDLQ